MKNFQLAISTPQTISQGGWMRKRTAFHIKEKLLQKLKYLLIKKRTYKQTPFLMEGREDVESILFFSFWFIYQAIIFYTSEFHYYFRGFSILSFFKSPFSLFKSYLLVRLVALYRNRGSIDFWGHQHLPNGVPCHRGTQTGDMTHELNIKMPKAKWDFEKLIIMRKGKVFRLW